MKEKFGKQDTEAKGYWRDEKNRSRRGETDEPTNLSVVHGRNTASFYEILIYPDYDAGEHGSPRLVAKHQVYYGDQLNEEAFVLGLYHAHNLAVQNPTHKVLYVRQDESRLIEENQRNAPFHFVDGEWRK